MTESITQLAGNTNKPIAVKAAFEKWSQLVDATHGGLHFISPATAQKVFLQEVLLNKGTDADFNWLIEAGVFTKADSGLWEDAINAYAVADMEDPE
jgi:hypothetical protein